MDVLKKFACNERIHCEDDIEIVYYSGLADMAIEDVICYACGDKLSTECMSNVQCEGAHEQNLSMRHFFLFSI